MTPNKIKHKDILFTLHSKTESHLNHFTLKSRNLKKKSLITYTKNQMNGDKK